MDWSKVELPEFKNKKIQVQKMSNLDYAKLVVTCSLMEKSLSQEGQNAIYAHIQQTWQQQEERLQIEANRRGISLEECFLEVLNESLN